MRFSLCLLLMALCACGGRKPASAAPHLPAVAALLAVQQARCAACHSLGERLDEELRGAPLPSLATLCARVDLAAGQPSMANHFCGEDLKDRSDVRAWLRSMPGVRPRPEPVEVSAVAIERGGQLVRELGCGACHAPAELDLATSHDHAQLAAWLRAWPRHEAGVAHVSLHRDEAGQIAAWLLRAQKQAEEVVPGFAYACYELPIEDGNWPDLAGLEPKARGVHEQVGLEVATRKDHYALQFTTSLHVPADGEWQFSVSSDDGSWLWIDGELVVDNPGLKPPTLRRGRVQLTPGNHALRIGFTQAGGGAELRVLWSGPGIDEQEISTAHASASLIRLVAPVRGDASVDDDAVLRGRQVARAARCDRCHQVDDPEFHQLPAPPPPRPWRDLGHGACVIPTGQAVHQEVSKLPEQLDVAVRLQIALSADGCLSCHVRDGRGGLPKAVLAQLVQREDLGDEGLLPPDLTAVGRRLRPEWIARVVAEGHKVRDYVAMRMPAYGEHKGQQYAEWFGQVDAPEVVDEEPAFSVEAVELGATLAGVGGRNCISCHTMMGYESLGPQGMDLAVQHARLRPGWFRDWLLRPTSLRKDTRMPTLWLSGSEQDRVEVDAIRTWLSLGPAAPLPKGIVLDADSMVLEPVDRPILHGAFLKGVGARCLAVGTPMRVHFAFDLAQARLAWIWRGAFLDARGTWHGRAGKLLQPLGHDWVVVEDFQIEGGEPRRMLGQTRSDDGYPVLRVACGEVLYQDGVRPRLTSVGGELVRRIHCDAGELVLQFPESSSYSVTVDGQAAGRHVLAAGQTLEIVYQW